MAQITAFTSKTSKDSRMTAVSALATVATSDTVLMDDLDGSFRHGYLAVRMFDAMGDQIIDVAGTFTVDYQTELNDSSLVGTFEDPSTATIDATAPITLSWTAPTNAVRVSLASETNTITWQVVFVAYKN